MLLLSFLFCVFFLPAFRYFIQFLDAFVQRPHERLFLRKTYKNKKEKTKQARRERGRERERRILNTKTRQIVLFGFAVRCVRVSKILNDLIDSFQFMVFKRDLVQDKTNPNKNKEKYYGLRPHLVVPTPGIVFLLVYYCFIVVFFILRLVCWYF